MIVQILHLKKRVNFRDGNQPRDMTTVMITGKINKHLQRPDNGNIQHAISTPVLITG